MTLVTSIVQTLKTFTPFTWTLVVTAIFYCYYLLNRFYRWRYDSDSMCYNVLCAVFITLTSIGTLVLIVWNCFLSETLNLLHVILLAIFIVRSYLEISNCRELNGRTFIDDDIKVDDIVTITSNHITTNFKLLGKVRLDGKLYYVMVTEEQFLEDNEDDTLHANIFEMSFDPNYVCVDATLITNKDEVQKIFEIFAKERGKK